MKAINRLETKILISLSGLALMSMVVLVTLVNKYSYITFSHFVETCKQLVHTSLPFVEHLSGTLAFSLPLLSGLLLFLYVVTSYIKTEIKIKKLLKNEVSMQATYIEEILERNKVAKETVRIVNYKKPLAVTYGFFKQKILISDWIVNNLTKKEIEAILLHEIYHIKNRHLPLYLLGQATASMLFYFPIVAGFVKNMKFKLEQEADSYTKRKQKTTKHLKSALIKTLLGENSLSLLPNFSANLYENRINAIEGQNTNSFVSKNQVAVTLGALTLLLVLFVLPTTAHAHSTDQTETGICTTTQDCGVHCNHKLQQNFTPAQLQSFVR